MTPDDQMLIEYSLMVAIEQAENAPPESDEGRRTEVPQARLAARLRELKRRLHRAPTV